VASAAAYGIEQGQLYFSTVAAGATPVAANLKADSEGAPSSNITAASALWRGQNRAPSSVIMGNVDCTATIPRCTFDNTEVLADFWDGATSTGTAHGGTSPAGITKLSKNSKPLTGDWLWAGQRSHDGKVVNIRFHNAFLASITPTHAREDFNALDLNLVCLCDASGDFFSVEVVD